jgi:hypothetical protein
MGTAAIRHAQGDHPRDVAIYVGSPPIIHPPFSYLLTFNIEGLTIDTTWVHRDPDARRRPPSRPGEIVFKSRRRCEAFLTTGSTSTCPWTFEGQLHNYVEGRALSGHAAVRRRDLGLFRRDPSRSATSTSTKSLLPRYAGAAHPLPDDPDIVVLRINCSGSTKDAPWKW